MLNKTKFRINSFILHVYSLVTILTLINIYKKINKHKKGNKKPTPPSALKVI